jgi:hypothetical protein
MERTGFVQSMRGGGIVAGTPDTTRPRVSGAREAEILDAALELLVAVGYDRLTLEAVAQRARAS